MREWLPHVLSWIRRQGNGGVCAVTGLPRTGKSRLLKDADFQGCFDSRRVVWDPHGERDRRLFAGGWEPAPPWGGYWISVEDLVGAPKVLDRHQRLVVYPRAPWTTKTLARGFCELAELLWYTGNADLIGEEAALWSRNAVELLNRCVSSGGHARLRVWLVTQEWGRLYADARDCANAVVFFSPTGGRYRSQLISKCGQETVDAVDAIKPGGAPVCWRAGEGVFVP